MGYNTVCLLLFWFYIAAVNYGQLYDGITDLLFKKTSALLLLFLTDFFLKHSININIFDRL